MNTSFSLHKHTPRANSFKQHLITWLETYPARALALIALGSVTLTILRLWLTPPVFGPGPTDDWWSVVLNLVHGQGYASCMARYFPFCGFANQVTASREPIPIFIFTVVAWLFGPNLWLAGWVEILVHLAILLSLFALTRSWSGTLPALLAALGWAFYAPALKLVSVVSGDLIASLWVTLSVWLFLRARSSQRLRDWVGVGLSLGLAALSRSATLTVAVTLILGSGLERWPTSLRLVEKIRPALVMAGLVGLCLMPWLVRNTLVLGQPVFGSSLTGYNLYRHNYMLGTNHYFRYVGSDEGEKAIRALVARRTDLTSHENEAQMDAVYRAEGLKVILAHPIHYVALSLYRFLPLWFNWQVREAYGARTNDLDYLLMAQQALLLLCLGVGVWATSWRKTWPLWASILTLCLAYMAVDSQLRYLVSVVPLVLSLSAVGGKVMAFGYNSAQSTLESPSV